MAEVFRYQRLVQVLKAGRIIRLTIGIPVIVLLMYGGLLLGIQCKTGAAVTAFLTLLPLVVAARFLYREFSFGKALKKMQQAVGAASDSEMEAVLQNALRLGDNYFFTADHVLNYATMRVYPLKSVEKVTVCGAKGDDDDVCRPVYKLKIRVQGYPNDKMVFCFGSERLQARKKLES